MDPMDLSDAQIAKLRAAVTDVAPSELEKLARVANVFLKMMLDQEIARRTAAPKKK